MKPTQNPPRSRGTEGPGIDAGECPDLGQKPGSDPHHNFHVHGAQFRILDIDGVDPQPEFAGWKDTVFLPVRATARLAIKFGPYSDPVMPYMFHCHFIRHADMGMMGQYTTI